jgi:recombination protein RecA
MALKFYSSVRLDIRRIRAIKLHGRVVGNRTRVRVKKNKVAAPFKQAEFDIMYDEGISLPGDVLDLAVELDVIDKRGSYYKYGDEMLAQGRENTKAVLGENPSLLREIENVVRDAHGLDVLPSTEPDTKEEEPETATEAA